MWTAGVEERARRGIGRLRRRSLRIAPTGGPLGAHVEGVDLSRDPRPEDVLAILRAFERHHLLIFRDQSVDRARLLEIAGWFGPLFVERPGQAVLGDGSGSPVLAISNAEKDGLLGSGTLPAHSEFQYLEEPLLGVLLHAVEVPADGGDTSWSNLHLAYRRLDLRTRRRLRGLHAWSLNPYSEAEHYGATFGPGQRFTAAPAARVLHPVVRTHPVTGRKLLAVSRLTGGIHGLASTEESAALLARLQRHVDRPGLYHRHHWRAGDLVVFDNRCTNHKRSAFDPRQRRLLYRVQVAGRRPF